MPDERRVLEVLRTEGTDLMIMVFGGAGDTGHAVADPGLPSQA
jgi:hypothetical protein